MATGTRTIEIDGHALTVSAHASDQEQRAAPLLLLHGAGGNYLHWPPHLRRLAGRPVFALELPGHGRTPGPGLDSMAAFVALVQRWLAQSGLERCLIAGHSLGGAIALSLALAEPARFCGLILVGSGARLRVAPELLRLLREDFPAAAAWIAEHAYGAQTQPAARARYLEHLLRTDPDALAGAFEACVGFDLSARLGELAMPALIVAGADDRMTPPRLAHELHAALAGSELHILPATGHMIPIERPAKLTERIAAFLGSHDL